MDAPARAACFHCGEPVADNPVIRLLARVEQAFCCEGCAAAADWIANADLGDYYRLRSASGTRVDADATDFSAWDRDTFLAAQTRSIDSDREITVLTQGMRCAACAWLIDRALRSETGVTDATANAITGRVQVRWDPSVVKLSSLMGRMSRLGYRPWLSSGEGREQALRVERRTGLMRLGVAGLGAMQAMMFAEALYFDSNGDMAIATRDFFRWVTFLVATPVVFYSGWPFLAGMAREWRGRRIGMDTLVAGSTLLAYGASLVETIRGGPQVWYDAAVMFVLLLLFARMLELRARRLASARVDALARARPVLATREMAAGAREEVSIEELRVGDVVRVAPGENVPADARVLDHEGRFDEALLTGESTPMLRNVGDMVCVGQAVRLSVERTGSDTRVSEMTRLVERAQAGRPALAQTADRIASVFAIALIVCAALVFAWWHAHDPSRALEVTLAVLVISCPCALSLAIPAALTAAHGRLASTGILALSPDALSTLARVDCVLFDKTGTLTLPRRSISTMDVCTMEDPARLLEIAAALERDSKHPIATAFQDAKVLLPVLFRREVPGNGIEGTIGDRQWRIGRPGFAAGSADDGRIWLGDGRTGHASFELVEDIRADAGEAIQRLRQLGVSVAICSGDSESAVRSIAERLGIDELSARQSPEEKLARVRELQSRGCVVAMIGDGINDAPVLAGADVSLAMADGAAIAQRAADLVMTSPSLSRLPEGIELARRTRRIVRQNLSWAVAYNVLALPLAASGTLSPWLAAVGMAASSLLVTLNALRLARGRA
ncbi:MAG: heavy metal translocating P-type ATPase metal-binding domain-containing protein [Gammaproteobacteria bacterium]|nr:heavy metal translocating P-type ATPase metal-binding domain-containing protein [Gammaproteobacteria bacterium]